MIARIFKYHYFNRKKIFFFYKERNIFLSKFQKFQIFCNFKRKIEIPFVDFDVTTVCNLRCKRCAKCIPYFEKKQIFSSDKMKSDLELLTKYIDTIHVMSIIGGEPFLNPELHKIIQICSNCEKIVNLELTTNATVMPKEEVFESLQNSRVIVHISNYLNIDKKLLETKKRVIQKFEKYNIPYQFAAHEQWLDFGSVKRRRYTKRERIDMFFRCPMNSCSIYNNRVLYRCGKSSYVEQHKKTDKRKRDEVIYLDDIHSKTQMRKLIKKFFSVNSLTACNFCDNHPKEIVSGEQIGGK